MIVRPRRDDDLPACAEALRKVHDVDAYPMNWPRDPQAWLAPGTAAWVAVSDGGLVAGHVAVQGDELTRLFVIPGARRRGLAHALVAEARAWAAGRRRVLSLNVVAADRSAAIAFYESTGWRYARTTTAGWSTPDGRPVELRHYVDAAVVREFATKLRGLGWVTDLFVAGSLATGDYIPYVSDLDLVAITAGADRRAIEPIHRRIDRGAGEGLQLGCVYVDAATIGDREARHPTWTHGRLVDRILSGITRAELLGPGYAIFGRPPRAVVPPVDVRAAARAELAGYWTWAARRPHLWLDPGMIDLGLTSMARARHAIAYGELLTKTAAVERAAAPEWLKRQLRERRQGRPVASPRARGGWIAWRDAWRTTRLGRWP